jgi:serine/threonine protein kinase
MFTATALLCSVSVRLVGKGSFGSVYLVSRRRDGAQFVLKNMQIKNVPEKEIEVRYCERRGATGGRDEDGRLSQRHSPRAAAAAAVSSQSYQNEVALLTALEHPGIVSHIESFIDGDRQHMCIVMGYDHSRSDHSRHCDLSRPSGAGMHRAVCSCHSLPTRIYVLLFRLC